ncbi:glycosyltransferase [Candidatus Pseudothioglobus singularis]|jgi:glycosyltransferase involved in cell wall biosynthesis|nr:glycosyltransferase [Candidatus Pseudothioglobus singularis]
MHILNVTNSLDLKTGAGTAERTFQMSRFLASEKDISCSVLVLDLALEQTRIDSIAPANVIVLKTLFKRFYIPSLRWRVIASSVKKANIVHLMGHWSILNALVYFACRYYKKPYVVCPAGALGLFGRSITLKRLYNFVIGNAIIRNASVWLAVTKGEFSQFESYGIFKDNITIIPNGVIKEDFDQYNIDRFKKMKRLPNAPAILFMGRLNQIKGPDLLLEAFINSAKILPKYHLIFAGPDDGMLEILKSRVKEKNLEKIVHFLGYIDGEEKSSAYHSASLLVVPSRQEAMSIVALEAGICGIPIMITDQCGFSDICNVDKGLEVPASVEAISEGLEYLLTDSKKLESISLKLKEYIENRYTWKAIITIYINLYKKLLSKNYYKAPSKS